MRNHRIYTDAGLSFAYFDPGFSVTYNYNILKHLGIGIGTQGYVFRPTVTNHRQFTPALFADVRFLIRPEKISQYFLFLDGGINLYKHNNDIFLDGNNANMTNKDNGIYIGVGAGYFLRLTTKGWGPYITVKAINNFYRNTQSNVVTNKQRTQSASGGTFVVSLGFRFLNDTKE